jgi:tetratricopeptide (TPR) repeat protein
MTVGSTIERGLYQMPGCQHTQVYAIQRVSARLALALAVAILPALPLHAQGLLDPVRQLYNQGRYDQAIAAAAKLAASASPDTANLLLGRSYLERFRKTRDDADLVAAREALRAVRPAPLSPGDRSDYLVGLGELLYLQEAYGAAVEMFRTALDSGRDLGSTASERVFDWWATALDRQVQSGVADDRDGIYRAIRDRAFIELGRMPWSIAASYWIVAASRYLGDLTKAYDAAVAGWIRAPFREERGLALRADLDQLVTEAIIPERVRALASTDADRERVAEALRAAWDGVKKEWPTK